MTKQAIMHALSADLWRMSSWIYRRQDHLVRSFLPRDQEMAKDVFLSIGTLTLQDQLKQINEEFQDENLRLRAADRALTTSRILWFLSQRLKSDLRRELM